MNLRNNFNQDVFIKDQCEQLQKNSKIKPGLYTKFNVKRGLRNNDGTGVLVGLTEIGDVHAYVMDENEKVPVEGRLLYRGIDINDLVAGFQKDKRFGFEECCYLLLFGNLPTRENLDEFNKILTASRNIPDRFLEDMILNAPSNNIMNKLARSVLAAYSFDSNPEDESLENIMRQSIELIARFPIYVAYGYHAKSHYHDGNSLYIHAPREDLSTSQNILHLIRSDSQYSELEAETLDLALVLHAEHGGGNNSSFVTHVVSSSGTDTYSAVAAAIGSLKGSKHGGANHKVMEMMKDIKEHVANWEDESEVADYIGKILKREAFDKSGLVYGMGHAVYTLSDPRCVLFKEKAEALAKEKGCEKEYNLYTMIERLTPQVFYEIKKVNKVMCANIDFYSGFVYSMLNIPQELYVPIFAISRVAGWCAHRIEEVMTGGRIIRPAYKSVVHKREYLDINSRT